jgi:S-DNA-T family DNA segregation ATPase FtsK/SpoIIIE
LTKSISLFDLLGIRQTADLDLGARWAKSEVFKSMAAPLGVKTKNEVVYLDIGDKASAHGPHGLVAGTTGSGESEILQSYVLSLASLFAPEDVGFVIIDFKGGGMSGQFDYKKKGSDERWTLPHLIGVITNIDGREINRSLLSIKAEIVKRQERFAEYEVNHINDYIRLRRKDKSMPAIPHLIIIVDEFAELKTEYPDFMKELVSAARIGRTLGVHLILATQKPSGVVDPQI